MFPRSPSGFTDIKIANVIHHPVQAKNMNLNPSMLKFSSFVSLRFFSEKQVNAALKHPAYLNLMNFNIPH